MKLLESHSKLTQIQTRLSKQSYLSRSNLPGWADGKMFLYLESIKRYPDRRTYPNFYHWYILIKQFALSSIQKWVLNSQGQDQDNLILDCIHYKTSQKILCDSMNLKKDKPFQNIIDEQIKLIRSEDLTMGNQNQIQYVMDVKIKEENSKNMRQLVTNFLNQQELEHQNLQIIPEQKRVRIVMKMDSIKYEQLKNKISHLQGVQTFQSKKKDKKFQTSNSTNNFLNDPQTIKSNQINQILQLNSNNKAKQKTK